MARPLLRRFLAGAPAAALGLLDVLGGRQRELQERYLERCGARAECRIARALVRLAHQAGQARAGEVRIDLPVLQQDLAAMTGASVHTVSRVLGVWEDQGSIETRRGVIFLCALHRLISIAEDLPA